MMIQLCQDCTSWRRLLRGHDLWCQGSLSLKPPANFDTPPRSFANQLNSTMQWFSSVKIALWRRVLRVKRSGVGVLSHSNHLPTLIRLFWIQEIAETLKSFTIQLCYDCKFQRGLWCQCSLSNHLPTSIRLFRIQEIGDEQTFAKSIKFHDNSVVLCLHIAERGLWFSLTQTSCQFWSACSEEIEETITIPKSSNSMTIQLFYDCTGCRERSLGHNIWCLSPKAPLQNPRNWRIGNVCYT